MVWFLEQHGDYEKERQEYGPIVLWLELRWFLTGFLRGCGLVNLDELYL